MSEMMQTKELATEALGLLAYAQHMAQTAQCGSARRLFELFAKQETRRIEANGGFQLLAASHGIGEAHAQPASASAGSPARSTLSGSKSKIKSTKAMVAALSAGTAMAMGSGPRNVDSGPKASVGGTEISIAVPDISQADLKQAMANNAVTLLDCNGSKSYANGHLPGAIDFESAKADLVKKLPKDKSALVVAYCGGPKCMAYKAGAEAAIKLGYTNVKYFSGGLSGWTDAGATVESAALCPMCGQIRGSDVCCKAGASKCGTCGMAEGSPGCCAVTKAN